MPFRTGQWALVRDCWRAGRGGGTRGGRATVSGLVCVAAETVSPPGSPCLLGSEPRRLTPRGARFPARHLHASVDLWPWATRFRALPMDGVVAAIPDLCAVGSALLRPRLRVVGSFGRGGHTAHSTIVHGCAIVHAAEAMPPRRPGHAKLTREWSQRYACLHSGRRTGQCSLAHTDTARLAAPALRWVARRCADPPSARQRARPGAAPCLTSSPPEGHSGQHRLRCTLPVP